MGNARCEARQLHAERLWSLGQTSLDEAQAISVASLGGVAACLSVLIVAYLATWHAHTSQTTHGRLLFACRIAAAWHHATIRCHAKYMVLDACCLVQFGKEVSHGNTTRVTFRSR
jgi:hypothetical protein